MTTLANENDVAPAQGDVDDALASSMVEPGPASELKTEAAWVEADYRRERAASKASALEAARCAARESGDWSAFEALESVHDLDDSDVPYAERGRHVRSCGEPWLLHGLKDRRGWLSPDDAAVYEHRLEVSDALYASGHPFADGRLLFPEFKAGDREDFAGWRPWNSALLKKEDGEDHPFRAQRLAAVQKRERFNAALAKVAEQHASRHWFYAHPFCSECFPDHPLAVDGYYASWLLRQDSETRFPAESWDGQVPPMPHVADVVDFMSVDDLKRLPKPGWLIDGVLPDSGTGILRARDQSFKSFMALSMALEVALAGRCVLYCVAEGANNFSHRIDAWLEHTRNDNEDIATLDLYPSVPNLFTGGDSYDRVLAKARREQYDLIVIDTYARATAGSDLNSQGDQSVVTARVDELKRSAQGTILLVAHSQKSDLDSSGSIEIEDARDFVFSMKRTGNEVTFEVVKQKDGTESASPARLLAKPVGESIVLVDTGEAQEPLMTIKDWIIAALDNTIGLGPQTEVEIRGWINSHDVYRRSSNKELGKSTCSSTLSRLVQEGRVVKGGRGYTVSRDAS